MKIVLIGTIYPPYAVGGAEKAIAMLAEALVRRSHKVVVITLHPGELETMEEREGVRIYRLPLDNIYWPFTQQPKPKALLRLVWHLREMWNWRAARRIGRILDLETPDVVHTHNISGFSVSIWRAVKLRGIRLIHTLHDYYLLCPRATRHRRGRSCESICRGCQVLTANRKTASGLPDEIVSVSQFTLDKHKSFGLFHNIPSRVIYNIQSTSDNRAPDSVSNAKSAGLSFGFIGRIEPEKGIETVLRATQHLIRPGWRFRIAGRGTDAYVGYLRKKYPDERIEWLGLKNASEFYSMIDVVVIPSEWEEPLGYVCLESLHQGKALICANVGGLPEIAGLSTLVEYFEPGSVEQLSRLMNCALGDQIKWKVSMAPAAVALEPFTEEAVVGKYVSAYRCGARLDLPGTHSKDPVPHFSQQSELQRIGR
jgi:glycosyltransferase involved in cell wall biosynthesis